MKKSIRPIQSLTSQLIGLCLNLTIVAIVAGVVFTVWGNVVSGRTYSPAVVLGFGKFIYKSISPVAYWMCIGLYSLCILIGIAIAIQQFFELFSAQKRKAAFNKPPSNR